MKRILTIIIIALSISGCGKKTEVKGVVYSFRNVPVPNVAISYEEFRGADYPETYYNAGKTNNKGEYILNFKASSKYKYKVKCQCDSGYSVEPFEAGKTSKIDLHLK